MGFFAVIRKIYTRLLSAAGTLLTRFRGTSAPKQPRAISSSVKRTPIPLEAEAPGFPAIPLEKAVLPADVEAQLAAVNWDRRDVLVGTLRNAAQLKACLDGRFYYIPAALVTEEDKPIHYVALFQTPRVFPGHAGFSGTVQFSAVPWSNAEAFWRFHKPTAARTRRITVIRFANGCPFPRPSVPGRPDLSGPSPICFCWKTQNSFRSFCWARKRNTVFSWS